MKLKLKNFDYGLWILVLLIFSCGLITIYSATYGRSASFCFRQSLWMVIALLLSYLVYRIGYQHLVEWGYWIYFLSLLSLLAVIFLAPAISGAQRWLKIFGIGVQPSEFAKLGLLLALARFLSINKDKIRSLRTTAVAVGMTLVFIILIFFQPDLGSAFILIPLFLVILFSWGVPLKNILYLICGGIVSLPIIWHFLRDYQKERLLVFLNPNLDPLGAGYTIIQSKIALGSGGLLGEGFLRGRQSQLHFLPESHTDFIFAVFGEEWGFLGSIILLFLYLALIKKIFNLNIYTKDPSARILITGISALIFIHVFINVGMVIGIMPVVGLPLPLLSYGGSNLVATMIAIGIVSSISKNVR